MFEKPGIIFFWNSDWTTFTICSGSHTFFLNLTFRNGLSLWLCETSGAAAQTCFSDKFRIVCFEFDKLLWGRFLRFLRHLKICEDFSDKSTIVWAVHCNKTSVLQSSDSSIYPVSNLIPVVADTFAGFKGSSNRGKVLSWVEMGKKFLRGVAAGKSKSMLILIRDLLVHCSVKSDPRCRA